MDIILFLLGITVAMFGLPLAISHIIKIWGDALGRHR